MTAWDAAVATMALICIGSVVYLIASLIRAAWPPKRNRYLPKPRSDERSSIEQFKRIISP